MREADIALSVAKRHGDSEKIVALCAEHGGTGGESREPGGGSARRAGEARAARCCSSRSSTCEPTRWWVPRRYCAGAIRWRACSRRTVSCAWRRKPASWCRSPAGSSSGWCKLAGEWLRRLPAEPEVLHQHQSVPDGAAGSGLERLRRLAAARDSAAAIGAEIRGHRGRAHRQRRRGPRNARATARHGHPADAR